MLLSAKRDVRVFSATFVFSVVRELPIIQKVPRLHLRTAVDPYQVMILTSNITSEHRLQLNRFKWGYSVPDADFDMIAVTCSRCFN